MGMKKNTWSGPVAGTHYPKPGEGMHTWEKAGKTPATPGGEANAVEYTAPTNTNPTPMDYLEQLGMHENTWSGPVAGTDFSDGGGMHSYDKESGVAKDGKTPEESTKDAGFAAQSGGMIAQRKDAFAPGGQGTPLEGISLGSDRVRGALANIPGFEHLGPSPDFVKPAGGEVDLYRSAVEMANEFQLPVQYKMTFNCPQGIYQPNPKSENQGGEGPESVPKWTEIDMANKGMVQQGGIDWQTHKMNRSTAFVYEDSIKFLYNLAAQASVTQYDPERGGDPEKKQETILNLFCSKVSMPEKSINFQSMRHYGTHFAYPQSVSFGTMSTTFYCDASMHIKKYFDAWQKLIFNDITGNFNYYEEFTSEFDIFTRSVVGVSENADEQDKNWFEKGQDSFREVMDTVNQYTGLQGRSGSPHRTYSKYKYPKMEFRNTYGVKVMECWPQIVGSVDLGHASTNSIAEFTVTWAYKKWNTFNLGEIGKRGQVNLSNSVLHEKGDGIPFVQDMPQELRGPLTQAADQNIMSQPLQRGFAVTG